MAEKQFDGRLQLKHDTTANWSVNSNKVLLSGEIGIEFTTDGKKLIKIGDGKTTWANLDYYGKVSADGKSIELNAGGDLSIKGYSSATVGQQPRIASDGTIEWYTPDTSSVSGLQETVGQHTQQISTLGTDIGVVKKDITNLKTEVGGIDDRILAEINKLSSVYDAKGSAQAVLGNANDGSSTNTVYGAKKAAQEALTEAQEKVASVTNEDNSIVIGGNSTSPTVKVNVDSTTGNALKLNANGLRVDIPEVTVPEYTVEKLLTAQNGFIASYVLKKDNFQIGEAINIPKDYLVKSANIKTAVADDPSKLPIGTKYIDFIINTKEGSGEESHIYLNVAELVDAYKQGNGITITADNVVSAKVVTGNGLSVDASGIKMGVATNTTAGAMSAQDKKDIAQSKIEIESLDDRLGAVETDFDNLAPIVKTGNINDLVQTDGDILIINCGGAGN